MWVLMRSVERSSVRRTDDGGPEITAELLAMPVLWRLLISELEYRSQVAQEHRSARSTRANLQLKARWRPAGMRPGVDAALALARALGVSGECDERPITGVIAVPIAIPAPR